jgi:hypothetical protein
VLAGFFSTAAGCCANAMQGSASATHEQSIQFRISFLDERKFANPTASRAAVNAKFAPTAAQRRLKQHLSAVAGPGALRYHGAA